MQGGGKETGRGAEVRKLDAERIKELAAESGSD